MTVRLLSIVLMLAVAAPAYGDGPSIKPAHGRPYFMPESKRREIQELVRTQAWAKEAHEALRAAARGKKPGSGDGFSAALLYALEGDPADAATAENWLMSIRGKPSHHRKHLDNPDYWKGGQSMGVSEIHYGVDPKHYVAFDLAYNGLSEAARKAVYQGLLDETQYRMKWLDTWRYTPNLEFKPLFMAAFGGLTLQDPDALKYLYGRNERHGSYFSMIDRILLDGQVWHEANIYPIGHSDLWCMATMSFYGQLAARQDWFRFSLAGGGSPKGLMDYFIDTAYPIESDAAGNQRVRVVTYGDGATNTNGDLFLVNQTPEIKGRKGGWLAQEALIACYRASGRAPAYAKFVSMIPGYKADLWNNSSLPEANALTFPPAPSKVWPDFGLAMLRSIDSPAYWTDPKSIAAFQMMTKGYGHDHHDKFAITLFGAGKLLYPDFNAIQYEDYSIGWSRNSVNHCTMVVDEEDTAEAPCDVRHEFTPELKFLATSAEGVFDGLAQTRALMLSREYLLDLFWASSKYPRIYDYVLQSMGKPQPLTSGFTSGMTISPRYWVMENPQGLVTEQLWQLDFAVREKEADAKTPASMVRVTMAGGPTTTAVCAPWGPKFGQITKHNIADLGMLVARRQGLRDTVFAVTHEPYYEGARPAVSAVTTLAQSDEAIVVRVDGADFTDYAAVEWSGRQGGQPRGLESADAQFGFTNYAWLRIGSDGNATTRGQWTSLRVPAKNVKTLDGKPANIEQGQLVLGPALTTLAPQPKPGADPFTYSLTPALTRIDETGTSRLSITNKSAQTVSGSVELDLPAGLSLDGKTSFGPLAAGASTEVPITLRADASAPKGMKRIPFHLRYASGSSAPEQTTLSQALPVAIGSTLVSDYTSQANPRFRIFAAQYTAEAMMHHGMLAKLTGPDGTVLLDGKPLFIISSKEKDLLYRDLWSAFVWPRTAPAGFKAHLDNVVYYQVDCLEDRMRVDVDRGWNKLKEMHFTVPGVYNLPGGAAAWKRIIAVDAAGKESDAQPAAAVKVAAAEMELPGLPYSLAFQFDPPVAASFDGPAMKFVFDGFSSDWWSIGFCPAGKLAEWRIASARKAAP